MCWNSDVRKGGKGGDRETTGEIRETIWGGQGGARDQSGRGKKVDRERLWRGQGENGERSGRGLGEAREGPG